MGRRKLPEEEKKSHAECNREYRQRQGEKKGVEVVKKHERARKKESRDRLAKLETEDVKKLKTEGARLRKAAQRLREYEQGEAKKAASAAAPAAATPAPDAGPAPDAAPAPEAAPSPDAAPALDADPPQPLQVVTEHFHNTCHHR